MPIGDAQDLRGLLAAEPLDAGQQQNALVSGGEAPKRAVEIAQLEAVALPRRQPQHVIAVFERHLRPLARPAARLVAMDVVKDREQPRPQVGAGLKLPNRATARSRQSWTRSSARSAEPASERA